MMTAPRLALLLFLIFGAAGCAARTDGVWTAYSPETLAKAQAENKAILVHVWASWCITCKAQQPTLDALNAETPSKDAVFMRVDFDRHKDFLTTHKVPSQSTVVIFKGSKEVARSIAETDKTSLRAFVASNMRMGAG